MLPDRALMNSWNEFHEVACFPQVRATVKYAWLKNKWSRLLRKCWCSWGTYVWFASLFYLVVSILMKQSSRPRAVSRCVPFPKWKLLCLSGQLVLSYLTLDVFEYWFIYLWDCSGQSEVTGCGQWLVFVSLPGQVISDFFFTPLIFLRLDLITYLAHSEQFLK